MTAKDRVKNGLKKLLETNELVDTMQVRILELKFSDYHGFPMCFWSIWSLVDFFIAILKFPCEQHNKQILSF